MDILMTHKQIDVKLSDTKLCKPIIAPKNAIIKPITSIFTTGEQVLYSLISEDGQSLAIFDTIQACKHYAKSNEYHYEFLN